MTHANLALRFLLELAALAGLAQLAWTWGEGATRLVFAVCAIVLTATIWGLFNVPLDPSRSGAAPIPVPGYLRLTIELSVLLGGCWAFRATGHTLVGCLLAALVILHYLLSLPRIRWLLRQ